MIDKELIEDIILKHYRYVKAANFQGWDVLDGLNSRLFQKLPFHKNKHFRLFWIQFFRRSPVNLRRLVSVPREYNPKALALFISGLLNLHRYDEAESYLQQALNLYDHLIQWQSKGYKALSWGYNFDWQARAFDVPKFKPNMVCSVFAGQALLGLFESAENSQHLLQAKAVAEFILENLILVNESDRICFGYIPGEPAIIHNVNLLGAAFLARLYYKTGEARYQMIAEKSVRFSVAHQRADGAWVYGSQRHHQWVDNFHTGYNLVAVNEYQSYCQDNQFETALVRGIDFHLKNHYTKSMLPKYSDLNLYPLDVHCFAQSLVTFLALKNYISDHATRINMMIGHVLRILWDQKAHYFWYKKSRCFTSKVPYIRWSQAWMFYSLSKVLAGENGKKDSLTGLSGR